MSLLKEIFILIILIIGVLLITLGLTGSQSIGRFKGWVGILIGSIFIGIALWLG